MRRKDVFFLDNLGKFVVIEGVDGSGISTQTALLKDFFKEKEKQYGKTFFTKEPTDGPIGGLIRLALSKRLKPLDEKVMALLFAADRLDHVKRSSSHEQLCGIEEFLQNGVNVISDRYYLSSFAYQSRQVDLQWVKTINSYSIKPDLTILLLIPIDDSIKRRNDSRFQEELYEKEDYLIDIRNNFLEIAQQLKDDGENIVIVDGTQNKEKVFADIIKEIQKLFS